MEKKQARRTGRKPKTDPADYKYSFRLNAQEKSKFEKLFLESGARDRTIFIKKSIFSEQLKVIKVDKVSMDYYIRLGEFYRQFQAIILQTIPGNRQQLQSGRKGRTEKLRGKKGDVPALQT